jgi:hypothetical protein
MKARAIIIKPVLNGWIVNVGCQDVVFQDLDAMLTGIRKYYSDPAKTEKEYIENKKNDTMMELRPEPTPAYPTGTESPQTFGQVQQQIDRGLR